MGHAGTLDPFATGLVLIAIDNATRMLKFFDNATKSYLAGMHFGIKTDTGDLTGLTIQTDDNIPQFNLKTLEKHVKLINKQIPPKYSAKKINGKKAYELARQNKDFELKEKDITIHSFRVLTLKYPELYYDCTVSSGTYIRTLSEQIAEMYDSVAYTKSLRRTAIANISITQAVKLDHLNDENWQEYLLSYDKAFPNFQQFTIADKDIRIYKNGVRLEISRFKNIKKTDKEESLIFNNQGKCLGLSIIKDNILIPTVIFNDK